tara:strand:+ start:148 stop:597 length:450 start_codon:yes stop_codon:yes gene_type:complete
MNGSTTKMLAIFFLTSLSFLSFSSEQEVLDTIYKWSALESDLDAQSELIRDDRVMITSKRWPNQKENLMIQKERRAANLSRDPDSTLISTISSPVVRIYGEVAIADFVRRTDFIPSMGDMSPPTFTYITLVLVEENGEWGIAHTHNSSM